MAISQTVPFQTVWNIWCIFCEGDFTCGTNLTDSQDGGGGRGGGSGGRGFFGGGGINLGYLCCDNLMLWPRTK